MILEMEEADLMLHEPFSGYLVSIASSIHMEQSLSEDRAIATSAKRKVAKCKDFVKKQADMWPNMLNMVWHSDPNSDVQLTSVVESP